MSTQLSAMLLRRRDAADVLGISERKIWSLTASGEIPHVRIGRCVRYPADQLQQWIRAQTKGGRQ
jgi:excisionase family DNA binding protein